MTKTTLSPTMPTATINTPRLILRPWLETDAEELHKYACDPMVGTPAGWPPHTYVEKQSGNHPHCILYPRGICYGTENDLRAYRMVRADSTDSSHSRAIAYNDAEIGYWLARKYWGNGIIHEAVNALIDHARDIMKKDTLWIAFYDGNNKSRRVAKKCGFSFHYSERNGSEAEYFFALQI